MRRAPVFHTARRGISSGALRPWAYLLGVGVAVFTLVVLAWPATERFHAAGPANPGHADLACEQCHRPAVGTLRQQAQAKVTAYLGLRQHDADFMHRAVDTEDCQACHARKDDRHPVYRFNEPKFVDARSELGAHRCTGCHVEHRGERVSMVMGACETCHADIELREEPLDVSHAELAETGRWQSCLSCHDFHGNHAHEVPVRIAAGLPLEEVEAYLATGSSPYGPVVVEALKVREETP